MASYKDKAVQNLSKLIERILKNCSRDTTVSPALDIAIYQNLSCKWLQEHNYEYDTTGDEYGQSVVIEGSRIDKPFKNNEDIKGLASQLINWAIDDMKTTKYQRIKELNEQCLYLHNLHEKEWAEDDETDDEFWELS